MRGKSLVVLSALLFLFIVLSIPAQDKDEELWQKAKKIHFDAIVIDAHAHPMTSQGMTPDAVPDNLDLGKKTEYSCVDAQAHPALGLGWFDRFSNYWNLGD